MQNISLDPLDINKARPPALCPLVPPSGADTAGHGRLAWLGLLPAPAFQAGPTGHAPSAAPPGSAGSSSSEPQQLCVPSRVPHTHPRKEPSTDAKASAIHARAGWGWGAPVAFRGEDAIETRQWTGRLCSRTVSGVDSAVCFGRVGSLVLGLFFHFWVAAGSF